MGGILIVHASLGAGHASAARALAAAFRRYTDRNIYVADVLDYLSPVVSKGLEVYYEQTSEHKPQIYRHLYQASDRPDPDDAMSLNRLMGVLGHPFVADFDDFVDSVHPEAIICTMQLPLQLLTYRKQQGGL